MMCIGSIGLGSQAMAPSGASFPMNTVMPARPDTDAVRSTAARSASAMTKSQRSASRTSTYDGLRRAASRKNDDSVVRSNSLKPSTATV